MRLALMLLLLAAAVRGQGGRDGSTGVLFVAFDVTVESDAIHRTAWRALEPHNVERRRIATFAGDGKKARAYLRANKDAKVVVAYDRLIAGFVADEIPRAAVLRVYEKKGAHVHTVTDHARFFDAVALLPGVSVLRDDELARLLRATPKSAASNFPRIRGLTWVQETTAKPAGDGPLVSTSGHVPEGRAILTMRPDPRSLGLHVAAQVLGYVRSKKPFRRVTVKRMRLTVDLGAAKRANIIVPLKLLARADVVRRGG